MTLHISPPTDLPALYHLFAQVYSSSDGMCESLAEKYPDLAAFRSGMATILARPGGLVLTASEEGESLGFLTITPRAPARLRHTADLSMGVASAARGRGIGRQLLATALQQISSPLEIIYLMVRTDNTAAVHLYEQAGFRTLTRLEGDMWIGTERFDGLLMRARVNPVRG